MVGEVRGIGMMAGIELVQDKGTKQAFDASHLAGAVCSLAAQERGVLSRNLGNTMAFSPPLILTRKEVDIIADAVGGAFEDTLVTLLIAPF